MKLVEDLLLDDLGVEGNVVDLMEMTEEENLAWVYILVRSAQQLQVFRSGTLGTFSQRWKVPEPPTRFTASDILVRESLDGDVRLEISGTSYQVRSSEWEDLPSTEGSP